MLFEQSEMAKSEFSYWKTISLLADLSDLIPASTLDAATYKRQTHDYEGSINKLSKAKVKSLT